jgi:predicted N-acetyltransferase YhbS
MSEDRRSRADKRGFFAVVERGIMEIRATNRADIAAVDALLSASYPALLKKDYPPSVLVTALPLISRAQPRLVTCGTYYGVFDEGALVAAGGWSRASGQGGRLARVRHVVTAHHRTREGLGRQLMDHIFAKARAAGAEGMTCEATKTAVPFYRAVGFEGDEAITIQLQPGIDFPAVLMSRAL